MQYLQYILNGGQCKINAPLNRAACFFLEPGGLTFNGSLVTVVVIVVGRCVDVLWMIRIVCRTWNIIIPSICVMPSIVDFPFL